jgi:hypothetical protein
MRVFFVLCLLAGLGEARTGPPSALSDGFRTLTSSTDFASGCVDEGSYGPLFGFVLPMAPQRAVLVAATRTPDRELTGNIAVLALVLGLLANAKAREDFV